jgi:ABC-2 type transport system ATP-binding protein
MTMGIAIVADALSKTYRTYRKQEGLVGALKGLFTRQYDEIPAARNVSFQIEEGEFVGFLGPNGAGKTTVLKMLAGLLVPTSGTARVLDYIPWERKAPFKRQFSLVLGQKNSLWWDLPARESLELNRAIYEIDEVQFRRMVDELVDLLDVRDKLNVMVRELSLGERMKMELIAALIHAPKVLFLDEPTIGLDVVSQKKVRDFLRHYSEENRISTILTSHYMQDIEELCKRVIIIDHGQVFFDGELDEIIENFAGYKLLRFTFEKTPSCSFDAGEVIERTATSVKLKVPRSKVTEACRVILSNCEVHDFSVEEEPIEEVIRQVFYDHATTVRLESQEAIAGLGLPK